VKALQGCLRAISQESRLISITQHARWGLLQGTAGPAGGYALPALPPPLASMLIFTSSPGLRI
jgi:hypothetical protein